MASVLLALLAVAVGVARAEEHAATPPRVDWGGGYFKGGDSRSSTVATSGAAQRPTRAKPAPAPASAPPPRTDWGGGYFKGGDSASNTPAASGGADRNSRR